MCRVELIEEDIARELNKKVESLDESNNIKDSARLLIFIRGINDNFEMMGGIFDHGITKDLYDRMSGVIERLPGVKLPMLQWMDHQI